MLKNKSKIVVLLITILLLVSTCCFATDDTVTTDTTVDANNNTVTTETTDSSETTEDTETAVDTEIYNGDLYLFDNDVLMNRLVDAGNTVIVIEHNLDVIKVADHILDIGPEGGVGGGQVIAKGTPEDIANSPISHTGRFLAKILNKDK